MKIQDQHTWPVKVLAFLEKHKEVFLQYEMMKCHLNNSYNYFQHDHFTSVLDCLLSQNILEGYHCTRLLESEIDLIVKNGMTLQNASDLTCRIDQLTNYGFTNSQISLIKSKKYYYDRQSSMNFIFNLPKNDREQGIGDFLKIWGGEAFHEHNYSDQTILKQLKRTGVPCLIEVSVPISLLKSGRLSEKIARAYLISHGLKTDESIDHEDYTIDSISAEYIGQIHRFPDTSFLELTGCEQWDEKILE